MARTIIIVNATQIVTSESHPMGLLSTVTGFPKTFDSNLTPYNGDIERTMRAAKAAWHRQVAANNEDTNPARVQMTVTLEMADGRQILRESIGTVPASESEPVEE